MKKLVILGLAGVLVLIPFLITGAFGQPQIHFLNDGWSWVLLNDVKGGSHVTYFCDGGNTGPIGHVAGFVHSYGAEILRVEHTLPSGQLISGARECGENKVAIPVMWLLVRGQPGEWPPCILISPVKPSDERQSALCFNNPNWPEYHDPQWVADQVACAGPVFWNDRWVCDHEMRRWHGARVPLEAPDGGRDLLAVFDAHLSWLPADYWQYYLP